MKLYLPQKKVHQVGNVYELERLSKRFCDEVGSLKQKLISESNAPEFLEPLLANI